MKRFNHLNVPKHWEHYWSKYPEGYTILEALLNWVKQVDSMVDNVNDWNKYLEGFVDTFDKKLRPHVREFMEELKASGELEEYIKRSLFDYSETIKEIHVDYVNGDNSDDGTVNRPYKTIQQAFDYLNTLSEIAADGQWTIRLHGNFPVGARVRSLPSFRYPLKIVGDLTVTGEPGTIIQRSEGGSALGLWFEPADNMNIEVYNIIFRDFEVGFNGYGILMKDKGKLYVENCVAERCDIGFASINQGRLTIIHSRGTGCRNGVMSQYNGVMTVGSTVNTDYAKNVFTECGYGVVMTRGSQGHVDYNEILGSQYAGVRIDMFSRVNVLGNYIHDNPVGVSVEDGGWVNNNNIFERNAVDFQHKGSGWETRMHSQRTTKMSAYPPYDPGRNLVTEGTGEREVAFTTPSTTKIPWGQFKGESKKVTIKLVGRIVNPTGAEATIDLIGIGQDTSLGYALGTFTVTAAETYAPFEYELTMVNTANRTVKRVNKVQYNNGATRISYGAFTSEVPEDLSIRLYATTNGVMTIDTTYLELSIGG